MKRIATLFILLIPLLCRAQCKDAEMTVDKFTGDTVYRFQANTTTLSSRTNVTFVRSKGEFFVNVYYVVTGIKALVIGQSDSLQLKTHAGQIINLCPVGIETGKFNVAGSSEYTTISQLYVCSAEQMKIISEQNIVMMRVNFTDTMKTIEFKEKQQAKLAAAAKCIYSTRS